MVSLMVVVRSFVYVAILPASLTLIANSTGVLTVGMTVMYCTDSSWVKNFREHSDFGREEQSTEGRVFL